MRTGCARHIVRMGAMRTSPLFFQKNLTGRDYVEDPSLNASVIKIELNEVWFQGCELDPHFSVQVICTGEKLGRTCIWALVFQHRRVTSMPAIKLCDSRFPFLQPGALNTKTLPAGKNEYNGPCINFRSHLKIKLHDLFSNKFRQQVVLFFSLCFMQHVFKPKFAQNGRP